jgi:hypothetical protein
MLNSINRDIFQFGRIDFFSQLQIKLTLLVILYLHFAHFIVVYQFISHDCPMPLVYITNIPFFVKIEYTFQFFPRSYQDLNVCWYDKNQSYCLYTLTLWDIIQDLSSCYIFCSLVDSH